MCRAAELVVIYLCTGNIHTLPACRVVQRDYSRKVLSIAGEDAGL
jgi:hypothetical protein